MKKMWQKTILKAAQVYASLGRAPRKSATNAEIKNTQA